MTRWAELVGALTLLTRLPVGSLAATHPAPARCVWAYPVVGLLVGVASASAMAAGMALGLPQAVAALWALATTAVVTGGLHEDGLADTADSFGGQTTDRKLAIMRDTRIGSFGTLALLFSVALRGTALAVSAHPLLALLLAATVGRGAMLVPLLMLRPARQDGLGATLALRSTVSLWAGLALTALVCARTPSAAAAALVASLAGSLIARHALGGYTGDVLGAVEQVAECAVLSSLA